MKLNLIRKNRRSGFTLIELMVVIAIIATLAAVSWGPILDQINAGDRSAAAANLGNLHKTMQMFQTDHSAYPCDSLATKFMEDERYSSADYGQLTGNTSNCYFRQLFYLPSLNNEENFYAKVNVMGRMTHTPDNDIAKGRALEKGENGFGYVMMKGSEEDGDANVKGPVMHSSAPLILTSVSGRLPMGGANLVMDASSFRSKSIVLFNSGSVKELEMKTDDVDDRKGTLLNLFPKNKKTGQSQADQYIVLPPDL